MVPPEYIIVRVENGTKVYVWHSMQCIISDLQHICERGAGIYVRKRRDDGDENVGDYFADAVTMFFLLLLWCLYDG